MLSIVEDSTQHKKKGIRKMFEENMQKAQQVIEQVKKVIVGKDQVLQKIMVSILAGGHVLIEDIPGVGKTTMAMAFSKAMNLSYNRVQFTPDVMPSDITGFNMYNRETNEFEYKEGSIACHMFVADEINRTSPKTQAALLEAMEEGRVTVDGVTRCLPQPFTVIATQNPVGSIGTQMLPESQLDRFMFRLSVGYPTMQDEMRMLKGKENGLPIQQITPVVSVQEVVLMQEEVKKVFIHDEIYEYIVKLIHATRKHPQIELGISPRGTVALTNASRAAAYLAGKDYVGPEDVRYVFADVAQHRIILSTSAQLEKHEIVEQILKKVTKKIA